MTLHDEMIAMGKNVREASKTLARANSEQKNKALAHTAQCLLENSKAIITANQKDLTLAKEKGVNQARLDRIMLDDTRIKAMAKSLEEIIALPDPVHRVLASWKRPNGMELTRIATPLGVIGIIYESRPNVTIDAAALCMKSGNGVILRASSEIMHSATLIHNCMSAGLEKAGLPATCTALIQTKDREAVRLMLSGLEGTIDILIPRGGQSLVERVSSEARVPVIGHLTGLCHSYIDKSAEAEMAIAIAVNAKMRRTGICGATETILIDEAWDEAHIKTLLQALQKAGCTIKGDEKICALNSTIEKAQPQDWDCEYLDSIVSIKTVTGLEGALTHIAQHGSGHTEAIITEDKKAAERFLQEIDAAIIMHNASTQFADGGEFGMGAEIGIATGRAHIRGPVGLEQLTGFKYQLRGSGQTRPQ